MARPMLGRKPPAWLPERFSNDPAGQEQQRRQSQEQPEAQVRRSEVEDAERAPNADEQDDDDAEPAQRITCRHYCSNLGRRAYDGCIARNGDQRRCRQPLRPHHSASNAIVSTRTSSLKMRWTQMPMKMFLSTHHGEDACQRRARAL